MTSAPGRKQAEDREDALVRRSRKIIRADRYVIVLVMLGLVLLANAFLLRGIGGMFLMLVMLAVTLVFTLVTSDVRWGTTALAGVAVTLALAAGITAQAVGQVGEGRIDYQAAMIVMGLTMVVVIARRIARHPQVSMDTVAGAAAIYLLLGLVFAVLFSFVGDILLMFDPAVVARVGSPRDPRHGVLQLFEDPTAFRLPVLQLRHTDHRRLRGPDGGDRVRPDALGERGTPRPALSGDRGGRTRVQHAAGRPELSEAPVNTV